MLTVRTLRPDEADAAADLTARIFADPEEREAMRRLLLAAYADCPFMRPENCLVGEIDGKLVTKWQLLNFDIRMAGTVVPMCGVQGVAAEPDENHKGYARKVAEGNLPRLADLGFDFALGFAQRGAMYLRMGAVPVMADYTVTLDAYKIAKLESDPFREFDPLRDVPSLIDHYNQRQCPGDWPPGSKRSPLALAGPKAAHRPYLSGRIHRCALRRRVHRDPGKSSVRDPTSMKRLSGSWPLLARERGVRRIHGPLPPGSSFLYSGHSLRRRVRGQLHTKIGMPRPSPWPPLRLIDRLSGALEERLQDSRHHDIQATLTLECNGETQALDLNQSGRQTQPLALSFSAGGWLQLAFGYRSIESLMQEEWSAAQRAEWNQQDRDLAATLFPLGRPFMGHPDRY
ncbi:MAG: GNAT family N-acetyltransferase [Myxococcota bacterium]